MYHLTLCGTELTDGMYRLTLCGTELTDGMYRLTLCGTELTDGMYRLTLCGNELTDGMYHLTLCGALLTSGMYDLNPMWYSIDWQNVRSDHHVVQCWLTECTIWPPCGTVLSNRMYYLTTIGTVLTDRMYYLTTMWYSINWQNVRSDHHVVQCWLIECTIWPPCGTVLTHNLCYLTTIGYWADWRNVRSDRLVVLCYPNSHTGHMFLNLSTLLVYLSLLIFTLGSVSV